MKVGFTYDKKNNIYLAVYIALAIALYVWSGYPLPILFGSAIIYYGIKSCHVQLSERTPRWWTALGRKIPALAKVKVETGRIISWIYMIILFIGGPIFTTWCVQRIILEQEFFVKTSQSVWKLNMMVIGLCYLAMLVIIGRARWAWIITHLFFVIVAFADYFVYDFRENEITWGDMTTINTGISVASKYHFSMSKRGACFILLTILAIAVVRKFRFKFRHFWTGRLIALIIICLNFSAVSGKVLKKVTQTWEKKGTYRNGFVVNFICGIRDSYYVDPPAGYSLDAVKALEDEYKAKAAAKTADAEEKKPTIITIMDESFADFRLIGDLKTNVEVTPFIDSLTENTTRGYALASVFGAKTPNSEWEYMTGNTMAFLPGGSVPYQQFIGKEPMSMVSNLKQQGYTTVAMHPYYRTGWRRNTVYPKLGFDEMHFMDDGDNYFDVTNVMRDYITDEEMFDKIIRCFEEKGDDPMFLMGITMQNHGGYRDTYENFTSDVYQLGGMFYTDASQYLSLIHQTDMAVEKLINYFQSVDEPVEIIFFGDHYPSLNSSFVRSLNGKGLSGLTLSELEELFSVPFFVWTNYDSEEEDGITSSLNYLHTIAYKKAGIEGTPYDAFLADLQEVIPSMNARGYYSISQGKYIHYSDATGEEAEWIKKYRILQYNNMFGKSDRSEYFFPYNIE